MRRVIASLAVCMLTGGCVVQGGLDSFVQQAVTTTLFPCIANILRDLLNQVS